MLPRRMVVNSASTVIYSSGGQLANALATV